MYHSIRSHPAITATLLDFLCRIAQSFCPSLSSLVKAGVKTSLQQILEKRVLQSLSPLFDSNKLDRELRAMVRETFPEFCTPDGIPVDVNHSSREQYSIIGDESGGLNHNSINESKFSDEEEEPVPKKPKRSKKDKEVKEIKEVNDNKNGEKVLTPKECNVMLGSSSALSKSDLMTQIEQMNGSEMRSCLTRLYEDKDNESRCESMEQLVQFVMQDEDNDQDMASNLTIILLCILEDDLSKKVFPSTSYCVDEEELEDSIGT
ncbi:unnamed protein product, partial [Medioppia subpectinata]